MIHPLVFVALVPVVFLILLILWHWHKEPTQSDIEYMKRYIRRKYAYYYSLLEDCSFEKWKAIKSLEEKEIDELVKKMTNKK